jgi:ribosomal protein L7Ae-like RNA K-turn-binding protein
MQDKVLSFLGLCKKAGKLEIGEESVGSAQRRGRAHVILVASDAAAGTAKRAANYSEWGRVPLITLKYTKDTLGDMLGKRVCAVLAVTDRSMAKSLTEKIEAQYSAEAAEE